LQQSNDLRTFIRLTRHVCCRRCVPACVVGGRMTSSTLRGVTPSPLIAPHLFVAGSATAGGINVRLSLRIGSSAPVRIQTELIETSVPTARHQRPAGGKIASIRHDSCQFVPVDRRCWSSTQPSPSPHCLPPVFRWL